MSKSTKTVATVAQNQNTTPIDLATLTPAQQSALRKQLAAALKASQPSTESRYAVIDPMLATKDGDSWKYTTADILAALQDKSVVAKELSSEDRAEWLKRIQTRKQHLVKKSPNAYGFKQSLAGVGVLTLERVQAWATANGYKLIAQ